MIPCLGGNCYNGRMFGQLRAIAWITVLEALGHPATLLLTLASAAGTLALPLFQFQRFTEDGRLARDCGLATAMFFGVLLAAGGACRLTRALGDGTSAVALTKPVSRGLWLCGHALGTGVALMAYWLTQGAAVFAAFSFVVSIAGLDAILAFSTPVLQAIYPVAIVLIALGLCHRWLAPYRLVYPAAILCAGVVSVLTVLTHPEALGLSIPLLSGWMSVLPFYKVQLAWLVPAAVGAAAGVVLSRVFPERT